MAQLLQVYQAMFSCMPDFLAALTSPQMILALLVGVVGGIIIGALPGLNATTGIVLLMPMTYTMSPVPALTMLMTIYTAGVMGGSFSSILINTPGTSSSIATLFDGYPMARKGQALRALNTSIFSSVFGGCFSAIALLLVSPVLARVALLFDSSEYFLLALFGLSLMTSLSDDGLIKGFSVGCMGLLIGCVGVAPITSNARYTFNTQLLYDGFNHTTIIIGTFSIAQILLMIYETKNADPNKKIDVVKLEGEKFLTLSEIKDILPTLIISSFIGMGVGILPGAGAGTGSYMAYSNAKSRSKHPEEFGHGAINGIAAPECANNAVTGSAMIPLLTLSIPGSTAAAVLLGALTIHGLQPGFNLFTKQADIVFPIIMGFLLANIIMLPVGMMLARVMGKIVLIPNAILATVITVLAVLGCYCIRGRLFDIFALFAFGCFGYFLKKAHFSTGAFALGMILGDMCEAGLRRSFALAIPMGGNVFAYYLSRPQSVILALLVIYNMTAPLRKMLKEKRAAKQTPAEI